MKTLLRQAGVDTVGCVERTDLVELAKRNPGAFAGLARPAAATHVLGSLQELHALLASVTAANLTAVDAYLLPQGPG